MSKVLRYEFRKYVTEIRNTEWKLVEHCSANAEATDPVEASKNLFFGLFCNCLNCDSLRWSHIHFKNKENSHGTAPLIDPIHKKALYFFSFVALGVKALWYWLVCPQTFISCSLNFVPALEMIIWENRRPVNRLALWFHSLFTLKVGTDLTLLLPYL